MSKTLYLIRGVPGSGKSTLAEHLAWTMGILYFEADQWFEMHNNGVFNASKLRFAHNWCQNMTNTQLLEGKSVIVSNTSTTESEVEAYKNIAENHGANFVSIIVENRHGNNSVHNVPPEKIQQMKERFSVKL